ncbi:MAG: hypothetical protein N3E40_07510, partial [Dehalococcoidia bacterium]|nr:hypothetical protein [Dehalococcoidia bacterium]
MAQPFPFIIDGIHGDVPINMYPAADSDRRAIVTSSPGLSRLCTLPSCSEVRGLYTWEGYLWAVARRGTESVLWKVSQAGTAVEVGNFNTSFTGPVWFANNNTQLVIVDGVTGYVYTHTSGLQPILDPAFPGAAGVAYQDGYGLFIKPNSNIWFFSELWDFTNYDALDFYAKQSKPDKLVAILSYKRQPWLFGETSTEVWYNAGGDNSSPMNPTFALDTGGRIEHGCAAPGSVSDLCGEAPVWLTNNGQLRLASGYMTQVISNQMFERAVKRMSRIS